MEYNSIVLGNGFVSIKGNSDENDITIGVQYDGTGPNRFCIVLDCSGEMSVFEPTPKGLALALKQLAIADAESRTDNLHQTDTLS
jgi:hypothetical protein